MKQIVSACFYLHQNGILHRDLKPENILMHNGQPKLSDFGFSININKDMDANVLKQYWVGTPEFMAPEVYYNSKITLQSDIWSLGLIFYKMLCGRLPWGSS